jgi:hypothetical protein
MRDGEQGPVVVTEGAPLLLLPFELFRRWGGVAPREDGPSDFDLLVTGQSDARRCGYSRLFAIRRAGLTGLVLDLHAPAHWLGDAEGGTLVKVEGVYTDAAHLRGLVARIRGWTPWTSFSLPGGEAVLMDSSCHHAELEDGRHGPESWCRLPLGAGRWIVDVASEWGVEALRVRRG